MKLWIFNNSKKAHGITGVAIRKFHFMKCLNHQDSSGQLPFWKKFSQAPAAGAWLKKPVKNDMFS